MFGMVRGRFSGILVGIGIAATFFAVGHYWQLWPQFAGGLSTRSSAPVAVTDHVLLRLSYAYSAAGVTIPEMEVTVALWETDGGSVGQAFTTATLVTTGTVSSLQATSFTLLTRKPVVASVVEGNAMYPHYTSNGSSFPDGTPTYPIDRTPAWHTGLPPIQNLDVVPLIRVTGRFLDDQGRPLADVQVGRGGDGVWGRPPQSGTEARTDAQGRFEVQTPARFWRSPNGTQQISANVPFEKTGYLIDGRAQGGVGVMLDSIPATPVRVADTVMTPGRIVRGIVADGSRRPIAGARVSVVGMTANGYYVFSSYTTDQNGQYVATLPPAITVVQAYCTTAELRGFIVAESLESDLPIIEMQEPRTTPVEIMKQAPVKGARIGIEVREFSPYTFHKAQKAYDKGQREVFQDITLPGRGVSYGDKPSLTLFKGSYAQVRAVTENREVESDWLVIDPAQSQFRRPVRLTLQPLRSVSGVVLDPAGVPVAKARIEEVVEFQNGRSTTADENGRFTLSGISPSAKELRFGANTSGEVIVPIPKDPDTTVTARLDAEMVQRHRSFHENMRRWEAERATRTVRSILFQVRDSQTSQPVPQPKFGNEYMRLAGLIIEDEVTFRYPFGETYNLRFAVEAPGYHPAFAEFQPIETTQVLYLDPLSRVEGRVVDPGGQPVTLRSVRKYPFDRKDQNLQADLSLRPDRSAFRLGNLTTGPLVVQIEPEPPFQPTMTSLNVTKVGQTTVVDDIRVTTGMQARVRVIDSDTTQPLAGANVIARVTKHAVVNMAKLNVSFTLEYETSGSTNADGVVVFAGLPKGLLEIQVENASPIHHHGLEWDLDTTYSLGSGSVRIYGMERISSLGAWRLTRLPSEVPIPYSGGSDPIVLSRLPAGNYAFGLPPGNTAKGMLVGGEAQIEVKRGKTTDIVIPEISERLGIKLPQASQGFRRVVAVEAYSQPESERTTATKNTRLLYHEEGNTLHLFIPKGERLVNLGVSTVGGKPLLIPYEILKNHTTADPYEARWTQSAP